MGTILCTSGMEQGHEDEMVARAAVISLEGVRMMEERLTLQFVPLVPLPGHPELVSSERASVPGDVVTCALYSQQK